MDVHCKGRQDGRETCGIDTLGRLHNDISKRMIIGDPLLPLLLLMIDLLLHVRCLDQIVLHYHLINQQVSAFIIK